jgi:hypothetical protein
VSSIPSVVINLAGASTETARLVGTSLIIAACALVTAWAFAANSGPSTLRWPGSHAKKQQRHRQGETHTGTALTAVGSHRAEGLQADRRQPNVTNPHYQLGNLCGPGFRMA